MSSSNLIPKQDSPAHKTVAEFVRDRAASAFSFDGERGAGRAKLCKHLQGGRTECTEIALEAKDLFAAMQIFGFFCQLPQDPKLTHIQCRRLPE